MKIFFCLVVTAALFACNSRSMPNTHSADSSGTPQLSQANPAEAPLGELGIIADCPADTIAVHNDPADLLHEFIARDTAGRRDDAWADGAVTCVERLSSDLVTVVTGVTIFPRTTSTDSATFVVEYDSRYTTTYDASGMHMSLVPTLEHSVDTVLVLRTRKGWRLNDFAAGAHYSPAAALRALATLDSADQLRLRLLAFRPGT